MIDATNSAFEQMDDDLSILQQSLQTAFVGFQEAKRAFEDGTDEVRRLLLFECSLIYECNICRNLFRSLANFISHKRAYCCRKIGVTGNNKGFTDHNSAVILQTSENDFNKRSRSTGSSPAPDSRSSVKGSTRNICRVIERLKREKGESAGNNSENKHEETVLRLERVPTSTNAVYQTIKGLNEDSIKTEIDEVHNLLTNVKTVVGPDGKAFTKHTYAAGDNTINSSSENLGELFCKICNLGFQTNKTLQMHLEKKHNDLTYVYQCPACSMTFMKSAHVIRHLANEHKKTPRRIRMMRESIMKRRMRKCDVPVKGQNRELKRLQMSNDGANSSQNLPDSSSKWKVMSSCLYCDVKFERRAALSAHLLKCMAKREANSKPCSSSTPAVKPKLEPNNFYCNNVADFTAVEQPLLEKSAFKQEPVDANELNELFANLQTVNNGIGLQTISLERLELSDSSNDSIESCATHNTSVHSSFRSIKSEPHFDGADNNLEEQKISDQLPEELANENEEDEQYDCVNESNGEEKISKKPKKVKSKRSPPVEKPTACRCKICNKQFNAISNLRRHISMYHYRSRRFGCKMCDYHAFRSYDIVNHLVFVHKMTENREILAKEFVARHELTYSKKDTDGDIILVPDESVLINDNEEMIVTKIKCEQIEETVEELPKLLKTYERNKGGGETVEMEENDSFSGITANNKIKLPKVTADVKLTRSAIKRNSNSLDLVTDDIPCKPENPKALDKRPMRKRIKPINNDFVYDMSSMLKKDMQAPESTSTRLTRRRFTVVAATDHALPPGTLKNQDHISEKPQIPLLPFVNHENKDLIRTATQRILRKVVSEARAALSTMPDLPTERPQMRPRLTSTYQDEIQSGPIIDANDLEAARRKATLLDDAFLDKFTSHHSSSNTGSTFKIKPCLELQHELQHDTLNTLLEKMDTTKNAVLQNLNKSTVENYTNSIANTNLIECSPPPPPPPPSTETETNTNAMMLQCEEELTAAALATNHLADLQTPNGKRCSMNSTNVMTTPRTPPPTPRKRFTLLQHLAENKQRKVDSLLRSALQN